MHKRFEAQQIGKKKILFQEQWFDLRDLFNKFQSQFDSVARSRGITLEISVSEQVTFNIFGDPSRINDILKNLFTYALNHLDEGCIAFNVQAILVALNEYRLDIMLTTSGAGIPNYNLGTIFQPAYATGQSSLYIAKTLALLMRGDLTVENTFGRGTKYCLYMLVKGEGAPCYDFSALKTNHASTASTAHTEQ